MSRSLPLADNPFDDIPEVPSHDISELKERNGTKIDPIHGAKAKPKRVNYEAMTRKLYRDRGYCYYPWQHFTPAGQWVGGASQYGTYKDGFGCIDAVAINESEVVFLQTSSLAQKSAKKTKIERETYKIGGSHEFSILEVVSRIAGIANVRYVVCLWEKPAHRWQYTEIEVTTELLEVWKAKREKQ